MISGISGLVNRIRRYEWISVRIDGSVKSARRPHGVPRRRPAPEVGKERSGRSHVFAETAQLALEGGQGRVMNGPLTTDWPQAAGNDLGRSPWVIPPGTRARAWDARSGRPDRKAHGIAREVE